MKITPRSEFETIEGMAVILREETLKPEFRTLEHRIVRARGGFGCRRDTMGSAVFCTPINDPDGQWDRWERSQIQGVISEEDVQKFLAGETV